VADSVAVTDDDFVAADQYNNLRNDVLTNHDHDGTDGAHIQLTSTLIARLLIFG
jgi:hypothetical protein